MTAELHTVSATALRRKTRAVLKLADVSPVVITRYGRPTYVLMCAAEFKRIGGHDAYPAPRIER